jgi:RNA 2',3'-cyclic 3'-phosphodiesterase
MRVFAALTPPDEAVEDLVAFLEPRRRAGPELRWTAPAQWHVTLAFMATATPDTVDRMAETVTEAALGHPPVQLQLAGAGTFPDATGARVLWTAVNGDLDALARRVRGACNRAGGSPAGGAFHGHLTVARFRRPTEATRWVRVLDGYAGPPWVAREVNLVISHPGEGRGRSRVHELFATAPLTGLRCPQQDSNLRPRD